ncbi:lactate dehydrogenase-like 2-hydroxyacid dehydrogenase [Desulfitispora alkaliphila]|uniref:2-hydroxyacid dehydrogenase family protein n=1 Tax=Desulfitispora alkaliphila TaxID=622674 RepID=UPI003D25A892
MKSKIFITGKIPELALHLLRDRFDVTMSENSEPLSKEEIIAHASNMDALLPILSDSIDEDIIAACPKLKIIANYGAGYNNIDVASASQRKIPVTNTPVVSTNATAELTIGLIIAIARRVVEGDQLTRSGKFTGWAPLFHLGVELTGKKLGIIGLGNIGREVAKRAAAFDMEIFYYNRTRLAKELEEELGVTYLPFEELLSTVDFVSLNLSYHPSMKHMISKKELEIMKSSAYLINVARGPLVDELALLEALENNTIAGAALDVFEFEPKITKGLEKLSNIILTPHIGNATVEAREAMAKIAADNIIAALDGLTPPTCINPEIYEA